MLDYAEVPGMDPAAAAKANAKLSGSSGGSKKPRIESVLASTFLLCLDDYLLFIRVPF